MPTLYQFIFVRERNDAVTFQFDGNFGNAEILSWNAYGDSLLHMHRDYDIIPDNSQYQRNCCYSISTMARKLARWDLIGHRWHREYRLYPLIWCNRATLSDAVCDFVVAGQIDFKRSFLHTTFDEGCPQDCQIDTKTLHPLLKISETLSFISILLL